MSASGGTGAPVKMRTASPGPTGPSKRAPAAETPTTRRPGAATASAERMA